MKMLKLYRAMTNAMTMYVVEDTITDKYIVADWDLSEEAEEELIRKFEAGEITGEENDGRWETEEEAFGETFDRKYIGLYIGSIKIYLWTTGEKTWWSTSETSAVEWAECIEEREVSTPDGIKLAYDQTGSKRFYEIDGDGSPLQIGCTRQDTPYLYGGKNFFQRIELKKA